MTKSHVHISLDAFTSDFTAVVNAEMKVGTLEETITVTGDTPTVDVQSTIRQRVLDREVIELLGNRARREDQTPDQKKRQAKSNHEAEGPAKTLPGANLGCGPGRDNHESSAAIELPTFFCAFPADGNFLAIADG